MKRLQQYSISFSYLWLAVFYSESSLTPLVFKETTRSPASHKVTQAAYRTPGILYPPSDKPVGPNAALYQKITADWEKDRQKIDEVLKSQRLKKEPSHTPRDKKE